MRYGTWTFERDDEGILRVHIDAQPLTRAAIAELASLLHAHHEGATGILLDLSGASEWSLLPEDVRDFARTSVQVPPTVPRAMVLGSKLAYGLARMFDLLRPDKPSWRLFEDVDEALAWLREWGADH